MRGMHHFITVSRDVAPFVDVIARCQSDSPVTYGVVLRQAELGDVVRVHHLEDVCPKSTCVSKVQIPSL